MLYTNRELYQGTFALKLNLIKKHNQIRPDKVTYLITISPPLTFGHATWLMKLHFSKCPRES